MVKKTPKEQSVKIHNNPQDPRHMIDYQKVPSPSFVLEEALLQKNLELLKQVQEAAGISIILAFKGFAMWSAFPMVRKYLAGATASSLNEARLCFEEMQSKAYTYSPAYIPSEFDELMQYSQHITFNSLAQYHLYKEKVANYPAHISCGIRVNPEYSEVETELYNPCAPGSRLGETIDAFKDVLPAGIEGLHFHTLCESNSYDLEKTLAAFEERFGQFLPQLKWVNMGGGHLMTKKGYDIKHLVALLKAFKQRYGVEVILEPGSAIAWETGVLTSTVLDVFESKGIKTLLLDVSFTAHMPDTLEMPYRPKIVGATDPIEGKSTYRIGGMSCLSGDYLSEYSFDKEVLIGDQIIFKDMIHYTMVKTSMFNGVKHPNIAIWTVENELKMIRTFSYEDYKNRLS